MSSIKPGKVDWTGDNPFVYLKTDPNGDWSSLSVYFRIASSDYGPGHATLVLEDPYRVTSAGATRLLLTDNLPLAQFLVSDFVRHFGLFRAAVALDEMQYIEGATFQTENHYPRQVIEHAQAGAHRISLVWTDLQAGIAVDLTAAETQTQRHDMMCVFHPALSAQVLVNGVALPGQTIERDFQGQRAQSASLANSETWVQAEA